MSIKLMTAPPWIEPPMFMCISVGNMRAMPRPGPSGLNKRRPVAPAKLPRGKSPQLYQLGLSASGMAPVGTPRSSAAPGLPVGTSLMPGLSCALGDELLGLRDRLGGVEALRAHVRAVHDRVAAVQPVRVLELVE